MCIEGGRAALSMMALVAACSSAASRPDAGDAADAPGAGDAGDAPGAACATGWIMPNPPSTGLPHPQRYDTAMPGVVRDLVTGLVWQRSVDPAGHAWDAAVAACAGSTLAGLGGWRLPKVVELVSIVDFTRANPAIDVDAFPDTRSLPFWAAETDLTIPGLAYYVYFLNGGAYGGNDVSDVQQVRCVLDPAAAPGDACYAIEGGVVRDTHTTLSWERATDPGAYAWSEAQARCSSLGLDGGGWRLPSMKELMTLVSFSRTDPATDVAAFPDTPAEYYWSSSPVVGSVNAAWGVNFSKGSAGTSPVDFTARARCVR